MISKKQKNLAKHFSNMHKKEGMFVIPNAWDVASAYIYEKAGFEAVATSSAGIAYALGTLDGEQISFADLCEIVRKMADRISIPLSVDFERGYSELPEVVKENAYKLLEAGAVGFNIEDGLSDGTLSSLELQIDKIKALVDLKKELDMDFVINARTCVYWLNIGNEEERYHIAVKRGNAFADVGADCVFIPGAMTEDTVSSLVKDIHAPVNIILNGAFHDFEAMERMGVRRLSVGSGPVRYIYDKAIKMAAHLKNGNVDEILGCNFTYAKANEYFE